MNSRFHSFVAGLTLAAASLLVATPALAQDQPAEKQSTIQGVVTSLDTGEPIVGAVVMAGDASAMSDDKGAYTLEVPPGQYTVMVVADGYQDWQADVTTTVGTPVQLDARPVPGEVIVIVGVGSRSKRTKIDTPAPVDIISSDAIQRSASQETSQILAEQVPSYNSTHQTISDGTDHINPASLRGLGPDQTLVLINGKRRHSSALVNVNGTFGRGTVSTDLNAIPATAIKRIEVLRDGASAQYGSDAIAGVVNIVLKDYADVTEFTSRAGVTASGDGEELKTGASWGYKLGEKGVISLAGEVMFRGRTQRADPWTGDIFPGVSGAAETDQILDRIGQTRDDYTMLVGQSAAVVGTIFANAKYQLTSNMEAYMFGGYTYRQGYASGFYRLPNQADRNDLDVHPNGFLPEINPLIQDWSLAGGVRGEFAGIETDLSVNYGGNSFHFFIENSLNASLGDGSPTSFDAGRMMFQQITANADLVKKINALKSMSLVGGAEVRLENYALGAGDEASWIAGPETYIDADGNVRPRTPGAQVFPGFQPANEVDEWRRSVAAYVGAETEVNDALLADVAVRFENYSDFGSTLNFKLASRYKIGKKFAARGTVSTGFRAPSLPQVYFSNISTQFVGDPLEPRQVLTANNPSSLARAFGIPQLKQETSLNASLGGTAQITKDLALTVDLYRTAIKDRVVLSSRFNVDDMNFPSVSRAQFFLNAVDTSTLGADLVLSYGLKFKDNSKLDLIGSANFTQTTVDNVNVQQSLIERYGDDLTEEQIEGLIFNREERNRYEDALPRQRATITAKYRRGKVALLGRARYFGSVWYKPNIDPTDTDLLNACATDYTQLPCLDERFSGKIIFDTDIGYQIGKWRLSVGANNLFNTFPERHEKEANASNGRFVFSRRVSQFGINGGSYYVRLHYLN